MIAGAAQDAVGDGSGTKKLALPRAGKRNGETVRSTSYKKRARSNMFLGTKQQESDTN